MWVMLAFAVVGFIVTEVIDDEWQVEGFVGRYVDLSRC